MLHILRRTARGALTYGFGDLVIKAAALVLLPLYTRYLSPAQYGVVSLAQTVSSVLVIVLGLGLRGAVVRHYYDYRDDPAAVRRYLGTVLTAVLGFGLTVTVLLTLFGRPLFGSLLASVPFDPIIVWTLWSALSVAVGGVFLGLFRAREQAGRYVVLQLGQFALSTALILYFVVARGQGAVGWVRALLITGLVFLGLYLALGLRLTRPTLDTGQLRQALGFGLPLVPHLLAGVLLALADRFVLERMVTLEEVGLYSFGYTAGMAVGLTVGAVNSAWTPIFYDTVDREDDAPALLGRVFTLYAAAVAVLALAVGLFARELIALLVAERFHAAHVVVPAVATGYLFQGLYFMAVTPIFQRKRTRIIPLLTGISALVNLGLLLLWVPHYGMLGAAYATLVAFAVLFLLTASFARRLFPIPYERRKLAAIATLYTAVYIANQTLPTLDPLPRVALKALALAAFAAALVVLRIVPLPTPHRLRLMLGGDDG